MADERLFLLELLVDKITFTKTPCFSDQSFKTCVNFVFLDNQFLEVCNGESLQTNDPLEEVIKTGKSCMFPLKENDVAAALGNFVIKAIVSKSLPCGCLPTNIELGHCDVDLSKEFDEAQKESLDFPDIPISKSRKDSFKLSNDQGDLVGEIYLFLRISCFGKIVVNKYQGDSSCTPFSVNRKSAEATSCKPERMWREGPDSCRRGTCPYGEKTSSVCPVLVDTNSGDAGENGPSNGNGQTQGSRVTSSQGYQADNNAYCLHVPSAGGAREWEEVATELKANDLKIRVPKRGGLIKKVSVSHFGIAEPKSKSGPVDIYDVNTNEISFETPGDNCGGLTGENHFAYKSQRCESYGQHKAAMANALSDSAKKTNDILHPNRDVFVLKVAKRSGQERKSKLELELVTPKGPDKKMPPRLETRSTQCEDEKNQSKSKSRSRSRSKSGSRSKSKSKARPKSKKK